MNLYMLVKLLHVLASFWMISGVVGRGLAYWQARRATDVQSIHALLQVSELFERYAVIPVSVAVLVFGLILTWMLNWPLFGFLQGAYSTNWLLVSFLLFVGISAFIAPLRLVVRRKERMRAIQEALAQGTITLRLMAALNDKVVIRYRLLEFIILVVIIVLMVTKPF